MVGQRSVDGGSERPETDEGNQPDPDDPASRIVRRAPLHRAPSPLIAMLSPAPLTPKHTSVVAGVPLEALASMLTAITASPTPA
jgi:hypothetical protein